MGERRGTKALELWCRRITESYPGVSVQNMTTSWRDGLAFCAMIHHFRPDLIDFDSLDKDDVYGNNELAFRTAEEHLGIPALLDAEDMASCAVPDRLSILTYLSQFYQTFGGSSPSRLASKRTTESAGERLTPAPESPQPKVVPRLGTRRDPCAACGLPVFLAEKLVISRTLYHRTCFRCARCNNQLTLGNYYETEEGQYCCETCPDEETSATAPSMHQEYNNVAMLPVNDTNVHKPTESNSMSYQGSLCDEEKTERRGLNKDSAGFKEFFRSESQTSRMRLNFMASHLLSEKRDDDSLDDRELHDPHEVEEDDDEDSHEDEEEFEDHADDHEEDSSTIFKLNDPKNFRDLSADGSVPKNLESSVHTELESNLDYSVSNSQRITAISHDSGTNGIRVSPSENTKDAGLSLVQRRLKMFENVEVDVKGHAREVKRADDKIDAREQIVISDTEKMTVVHKSDDSEDAGGEDVATEDVLKVRQESTRSSVEDVTKEETSEDIIQEAQHPLDFPAGKEITPRDILKNMQELEPEPRSGNFETILSNMSGIELSNEEDEYPEDLNPFNSDEEDGTDKERYDKKSSVKKVSMNPFGSSEDEEEEDLVPPKPAARTNKLPEQPTRRKLEAPQINLNPFWSDDEEHNSDLEVNEKPKSLPVPKPRTLKQTPDSNSSQRKNTLDRSDLYASNTSITSSGSATTPSGTYRKKKPAPQPPTAKELFPGHNTTATTPTALPTTSPRTPRVRKSKPAPPPPMPTSTPYNASLGVPLKIGESPITELDDTETKLQIWQDQKSNKDETNRNRQSLSTLSSEENPNYTGYPDKSAQGKWKRKKGPAPPRPIPHRRKIKVMSMKDVKLELDEIEMQQQGLEKQGVRLEQLIRDKCETGDPQLDDSSLNIDVEELVLELFALVNEKNELFRRQAELMLLRRQQRLEEEHAEIEYQIRCLMCQPEATKTDFDKQREEGLIQRLVEIVERRNEIVECLEMDRRREIEEDRSIHKQMGLYVAKGKSDLTTDEESRRKSKKGKVKEKTKEKKSAKKSQKKDADKDVDESELKLKRHSKKKWF
ncbi:MICAL-like protein 1 isoform X2 [Cephus cinctus]|uniref:MICAL-like protein 1 isoform X2 n=1 Tax=Cephus cinctus TaxID=211228 RepID=A0AAJ7BHJ3_CEPCN|nr:MICAL-like protein 1 isoform X2 [Cephus cinctus]